MSFQLTGKGKEKVNGVVSLPHTSKQTDFSQIFSNCVFKCVLTALELLYELFKDGHP